MKLLQTRSLLQERSSELSLFIRFLEESESEILDSHQSVHTVATTEISAIMKSTVLLMNYSLIEALVVELVDELFTIARENHVPLGRFSTSVRNQLISYRFRGLRDAGTQKIQEAVSELIDIALLGSVVECPSRTSIRDGFLGNLDARKVRLVAEQFGVEVRLSSRTRGGSDLREIKDSRNLLAHGHISFVQMGQLKSAAELRTQTLRICEFLIAVVRSFERSLRGGLLFTDQ